ncbi:MAG: 50S ribosomal protein L21 [bacterium]
MKIAVIKTGGKQYVVKEGDKVKVEKLKAEIGDSLELETLLVADGENLQIGEPILEQKVSAKLFSQTRGRKLEGVKYKPKTRQAKRFGHRQFISTLSIEKI